MDQMLAIAWLRLKLLINGLRRSEGILNLLSAVVLSFFWSAISLGMAVLFFVMIWQAAFPEDPAYLRKLYYIVFFICAFCGVILPLFFESGRRKLEISSFLFFPISYRRLFGISQGACAASFEHLLYYPTLFVVCLVTILIAGLNMLPALLIVLSLWIFNLVWGHTIALGTEAVMKKRKGKEILGFVVVLFLIILSVIPATLESLFGESWVKDAPFFQAFAGNVRRMGKFLAPAFAAEGLGFFRKGELAHALQALMWLWIWIIPGIVLGYFIFVKYYVGEKGKVRRLPFRQKITPSKQDRAALSLGDTVLSRLPREVLAVAAKDWRYLMRSLVGKLSLVLVPVLVAVGVLLFARDLENPILGINAEQIALFGILLYVTQIVTNLSNNSLAWESGGIQTYFLYPATPERVILGKNLAIWCYDILLFIMAIAVWSVIKGIPDVLMMLTSVIFFAVVVLPFTSLGNFLSIFFPVPKDMSARDNSISQAALLISLASLVVVTSVTWIFLLIPVLLHVTVLQPLFLAVLLVIQVCVYVKTLRVAARLFLERREKVVSILLSRPR